MIGTQMSWKALNWAYAQDLRGATKAVLVALADQANERHQCTPGQASIAARAGCAERTVRKALKTLEKKGLLTRYRRQRQGGRGRTSDLHILHVPPAAVAGEGSTNRQSGTDQPAIADGTNRQQLPGNHQEDPSREPVSLEKKRQSRRRARGSAAYDEVSRPG